MNKKVYILLFFLVRVYNERMRINNIKTKNTKISNNWDNFQRGLLSSPRCKGCKEDCVVLYDSHHDQYFSENCGLVIMEQNQFLINYPVFYHYKKQKNKNSDEDKLKR